MPRISRSRLFHAAVAIFGGLMWNGATAHADKHWFSDSDGNWNNPANWDSDGIEPLAGSSVPSAERALLNLGTQRTINMTASTTVTAVQMDTSTTSTGGWNITADEGVAITLLGTATSVNNAATALRAYAGAPGSLPVTFAADIVLGAAAGATQTFSTFNDADAPLFTVSGDVSELNAGVSLNVAGGGGNNPNVILLTGNNTFTGDFIATSRAAVTSIGNKGEASAAGKGNRIVLGSTGTTGVSLEYRGSTKTTNRDFHLGSGTANKLFAHAGTGRFKFGGAITSDSFSQSLTVRATHAGGTGILELADGFENYGTGNTTKITVTQNTGTIILSGDNTFGANVATGDLVIGINSTNAGGTVLVNGTTSASANVFVAIGTLGGNGTINGAVTVGNATTTGGLRDSFLAPGDSTDDAIGHLTAASVALAGTDSRLNIELNDVGAGLNDGSNDLLTVTGALTLTNAALDFSATGTLNDTAYVLATYGSLTGTFSTISNLPSGYYVNYNYLDSNSIALVVPEPASLSLLTLMGCGLLGRRRRVS